MKKPNGFRAEKGESAGGGSVSGKNHMRKQTKDLARPFKR